MTNAECGTLGAVNLGVSGGTGSYTYAWTGPSGFRASTEDLSSLAAGTYAVTVTDNATQCSATTTATIASIPDTTPPVLRAAGFEVTLVNGAATILADDVDYGSFDTCSGLASIRISPSTFSCANVGSNNVTFTATDNAGNTASAIVTVIVQADATCLPLSGTTAATAPQRLQVYPNPATSAATLAFIAEKSGAAQLAVYNSLGQQVALLYNGAVQAGREYRFTLQSEALAGGVYTCRVRTAGHVYTTRLLIAK
ncbi:T9SS type A sorting domain-containing protein [Hymenobacter sp. BT186]|uniref:T9SS type A sorting domain-containing protein n=1 Tax=Hymenobacter telluris TaxID=2816474 RepID=A0A939EVR8_9BACT|nr:T9SS type A sorting domain-containing protein [Hymenobacter telluris]MBO0356798.1 T9SS type A sorting domain-containing protein [Hymenobacter telluris]MBW3372824.1 T9SS type A sorting domain-containing protein [Hymenobacter norwichensis]